MHTATAILEETLLQAAGKLPASPAILAEFNELTLDPHMVIEEATALLRRDSTLATGVVRVSNSSVYGGGGISAVEDAVARVGLKEVYRMVSLATTARLAELALPVYGVFVGRLTKSTLLHGIAAEHIAAACGFDRRVAYTAALVRTLGMRVIDAVTRECDWISPASATNLTGWELATIGHTGPDVAALVLRHWRFGEDVIEAVREQYLPHGAKAASPMAVVVNLAGNVVLRMETAFAVEAPFWQLDPEKLAAVGLEATRFEASFASIEAEYRRLLEAFN